MKYTLTLSLLLLLLLTATGFASKKDKIELKEKQDRLEQLKAERRGGPRFLRSRIGPSLHAQTKKR